MDSDEYYFQKYTLSNELSGLMSWPSLKVGLAKRAVDEQLARDKISQFQDLVASKPNMDGIELKQLKDSLYLDLTHLMYGSEVTPEQRQQHLALYGCAMYTDAALTSIAEVAKGRGVVEIGAGLSRVKRFILSTNGVAVL